VRAQRLDASALSTALADLEAVFASGNFDRVKDALDTASELYRRFCDDPDRRDSVARAFEASSAKVPPGLRLEVLGNFAEAALDHGDRGEALARARDAQRVLEGVRWAPEELIPLEARLAGILHGAGETAEAKRNLARALDTFERERYRIVDIERAGVLRAVGEAYASTGDGSSARAVYAKAVDEGVVNPNSKPRAEDLSATCRSMAVSQVEPGAELAARLHQILASLGEPW
jgi:tetratricopeptide (TPR) repeat protein